MRRPVTIEQVERRNNYYKNLIKVIWWKILVNGFMTY